MELINILKIFRRWAWLIVSIVGLTVIALLVGLRLAEPEFEAQVKIQISTPQQENVALYDEYRSASVRDVITVARNNFVTILGSDEIRDRTLEELNIDPEQIDFELEIGTDSDSDFVVIKITAPKSTLAASIANTLVDQAVDYYGELRARPTIEEKNLYAEQLQAAEAAYHAASEAFTSYKAQNNVVLLSQEIAAAQRLLEQLQSERDQRILEIGVKDPVTQVNELIQQRQSELDRLLALEPTYLFLEEDYQEAREEYRKALLPNVREVVRTAAEEKYRTAERVFIDFKTQNQIASLPNEITLQNEMITQLQLELDQRLLEDADDTDLINQVDTMILQYKKELDRLSTLQPTYNVLEQKTNEAKDKYQHILTKYTEAELKAAVVRAANFIQVVEPAVEPAEPIDNTLKFMALGILGSLGFGVILAFLLDYLTVREGEELIPDGLNTRAVLGLPVFGRIPVLKQPLPGLDSPEAEIIRQLRANILLSPAGQRLKVLVIASPQPGDGKTLTAANLAAVMADGKTRVALVDADLRHPSLHEIFDQPNLTGLADLLSADADQPGQDIFPVLRETDIPGLLILPAGKQPQDPSALLSSPALKRILAELSRAFDYVIIDTPPCMVAPDSILLSQHADGTLLVVRPGKTSLKAAEDAIYSFSSNGLNILGVAINHTALNHYSYRYYARRESKFLSLEKLPLLSAFLKRPPDPDLVSLEEAARMLGVRGRTVARWRQEGQLKARWINWRWWVKREELQKFLRRRVGGEFAPKPAQQGPPSQETALISGETPLQDEGVEDLIPPVAAVERKADGKLFSVDEAAGRLGVGREKILYWCREGRIKGIKQGGRWWVKQEDLQNPVTQPKDPN